MASKKIEKIYESLNDSEKFGLCFGLFPHRLQEKLDKDEVVELMDLAMEKQPVDFGGGQ